MKSYSEHSRKSQHLDNQYAAERELGGRLTVLSGLIGSPHWQTTDGYNRQRIEAAVRHSHKMRSQSFTRTVARGARAVSALVRKAAQQVSEYHALKRNIAELNGLNDRALRDIGIFRGDIAAIASKTITVDQINKERETLSRPALKLVTKTSMLTEAKSKTRITSIDLPSEAA